jgi:hypothetical protein
LDDSTCANCGTALAGDDCHECGQKRQILRTPQYLFTRPGFLTREFIEGRRVRYITPVRLYLSMIALFSVVFALLGARADIIQIHAGPPPPGMTKVRTSRNVTKTMERGAKKFENDPEKLGEAIAHAIPKAMFVLMPPFAALVMLFGAPHIAAMRVVAKLLVLLVFVDLYVALRLVYDDSRAMALVKTLAIGVIYLVVVTAAMVAILLVEFRMARAQSAMPIALTTAPSASPSGGAFVGGGGGIASFISTMPYGESQ